MSEGGVAKRERNDPMDERHETETVRRKRAEANGMGWLRDPAVRRAIRANHAVAMTARAAARVR